MQDKTILYPLVIEEAKNLKKKLTGKEKLKLNIRTLDPRNIHRCLYGQLTGDCENERATELIKKCCKRVYNPNHNTRSGEMLATATLNGSPKNKDREDFYSPIEVLIVLRGQKRNTKKLIQYIKGEIEELTLN